MAFSANYPGQRRITIIGTPDSDTAMLKRFDDRSVVRGTTARQQRACGMGGVYPTEKIAVTKGHLSRSEFVDAMRRACIEMSTRTKTPVWEDGVWGFSAEEMEPFNDEIQF